MILWGIDDSHLAQASDRSSKIGAFIAVFLLVMVALAECARRGWW